jgi:hypothetical protein
MGQNKIAITLFSVSLIVIIALLTVLSYGVLQTSWSYNYVVEPIDIINIIVTLLVSVFIAWYVTKRLSEERFDKELIISDLRDIESCIKKTLEFYDSSNSNNEILIYLNQLHILIRRFQCTINTDKMDTRGLENAFWQLFKVATDYDSGSDTDNVDIPAVQRHGNDLIIEVRRIIKLVNTK